MWPAVIVEIHCCHFLTNNVFLQDKLFPYAVEKAESFLTEGYETDEVKEIVKALSETNSDVVKEGEKKETIESLVKYIKSLMEKDSDLAALKSFQGLVYKAGYESGDLKGHVFSDVAECFPQWATTRRVCVYSTGSIQSQKLLFTHSTEGDLSAHITEYFDQSVGPKTESKSYNNIADKLNCKTEEIVFVTDSVAGNIIKKSN